MAASLSFSRASELSGTQSLSLICLWERLSLKGGKVYFRFNTRWSLIRDIGNKEYNSHDSIYLGVQQSWYPVSQLSSDFSADLFPAGFLFPFSPSGRASTSLNLSGWNFFRWLKSPDVVPPGTASFFLQMIRSAFPPSPPALWISYWWQRWQQRFCWKITSRIRSTDDLILIQPDQHGTQKVKVKWNENSM